MENIKIKLEEGGILPTKKKDAIGYDLFVPKDVTIEKGRNVIPLNFRIKLPKGYGAFIFGRSGMTAKGMKGYNIYDHFVECRYNCDVNLGLVDPGYEGVVGVLIHNHDQAFKMKEGESIAQMVIIKCESPDFEVIKDFKHESERGENGFTS